MVLPTLPQGPSPSWDIGRCARAAEESGASALWACDHLAWHTPVLECFTALTLAASATRACAVGTGVLQLPLRSPQLVAKSASSLQLTSGGRFVLGVGVGLHEGEFEAMDAGFHARGKRTDAAIDVLRELWATGRSTGTAEAAPDSFGGRYRQEPLPPPVPVWIGGSGDAALARAARTGDGWMPLFVPAPLLGRRYDELDAAAESAGRDPGSIVRSLVVFVSPERKSATGSARKRGLEWMSTLYRIPGERFGRHLVSGPVAACAEELAAFFDAGVDHLVIFVTDDEPAEAFADVMVELAGATTSGGLP